MPKSLPKELLSIHATFDVVLAQSKQEIQEAQRLRYVVFVEEYGAQLDRNSDRLEQDWMDPYCEHLLVRNRYTQNVVGTCRILNPKQFERIGGWYLETAFHLEKLRPLQSKLIEVGRMCVHPAYRQGVVLSLLWSGLEMHMIYHGYEYQMSCGSIRLADAGAITKKIHSLIVDKHLIPDHWSVFPWHPIPAHLISPEDDLVLPPLMREAIRRGALICGAPAWEPNFNTADFLLLLSLYHVDLLPQVADLEKLMLEPATTSV